MSRLPLINIDEKPFQRAFANAPILLEAFTQIEKGLGEYLEPELLELIRLRAAANNGCQYCQSVQRIAMDEKKRNFAMIKNKEGDLTEREKVALELTDRIMAYHGNLPEELLQNVKQHFSNEEMIALLWQIGIKNAANWFIISMQIETE